MGGDACGCSVGPEGEVGAPRRTGRHSQSAVSLARGPGPRAWGPQLERQVLEGRGETLSPAVQGRVAADGGLGGSGHGQMPEEEVA